jgi:hypothetical protein
MKHQDIKPGLILKLKPARREAYGVENTCAAYLVTGLKYRNGYETPYIQCGNFFFKPSDFECCIATDFVNTIHAHLCECGERYQCGNKVRHHCPRCQSKPKITVKHWDDLPVDLLHG